MSSSSIGAWPHHSDSRCPRISASSARRSAYSTSGVSETWIEAMAISIPVADYPSSLRGALATQQSTILCGSMDCFAALAMTALTSHMPDFFRHVVKSRMPVDLGFRRLEHHAFFGGIGRGDRA